MQKYAGTPKVWVIRENMQKYAQNMQIYSKYVGINLYAKSAEICNPNFADDGSKSLRVLAEASPRGAAGGAAQDCGTHLEPWIML